MVSASRACGFALLCSAVVGVAPAQAGNACDARLSGAQRARFQLATNGCDDGTMRAPAPPSVHADALVLTGPLPATTLQPTLAESAHLQLFARPGVVASRIGEPAPVPATATIAPRAPAATKRAPARPSTRPAAQRAVALAPAIDRVARAYDIDPLLLHAIAHVESRHDPAARSPAGARGVMQVMPATGQRFGVEHAEALHRPGLNLEVGAAYLKTLQRRFGSDLTLVLAAYNAGEGAVERNGRRVPPNQETQDYVRQVLAQYRTLTSAAQALPAADTASTF